MRKGGVSYVVATALLVAAVLAFGGDPANVAGIESNGADVLSEAGRAVTNSMSGLSLPSISMPALSDLWPSRQSLHWPSLIAGLVAGFALALATQVSWFELPRRMLRWLIDNERNFYRVGLAGICLGVLLFY